MVGLTCNRTLKRSLCSACTLYTSNVLFTGELKHRRPTWPDADDAVVVGEAGGSLRCLDGTEITADQTSPAYPGAQKAERAVKLPRYRLNLSRGLKQKPWRLPSWRPRLGSYRKGPPGGTRRMRRL